jgi:type I restriction enzyme, S subunit
MGDTGFRDTPIGTMPDEWDVVRLADVVTFTQKPVGLNIMQYEAIPFIPMEVIPTGSITTDGYFLKSPREITSGTYVQKGDILLPKITPSFENGKQAIVDDLPTSFAYATTEIFPLHPTDPSRLNRLFLFHYLKLPRVRKEIAGKMEGSTGRQRVPKAVIQDCLLPLPPINEQRAIAHMLSIVRLAIEATDRVIDAARQLKRSMMQHLFTYGPVPPAEAERVELKETKYGSIPCTWKILSLDKCAYVQTGTAKGRKFGVAKTITVPYLRVANVQDGYLSLSDIKEITIRKDEFERYLLRQGDVLLTEGGDFDKLGRGFIWNDQIPGCVHQNHIFAVRTNREILLPEYFTYLVQSFYGKGYFLEVAHRTTHLASINSTKVKAFPVVLPSIEVQRRIVRSIESLDVKLQAEARRKASLEIMFASLLQQLMVGKLRVSQRDN